LMVQRTVEVANDGAGLADGLALQGLVAAGQTGFGTPDALAGAFKQQRNQAMGVRIDGTAGNADLAVLLGIVAVGTVHVDGTPLIRPLREWLVAAAGGGWWMSVAACAGRGCQDLEANCWLR